MGSESLVERIKAAKAEAANNAAVDLAIKTLDSQGKGLQGVADSLSAISSLDAIISRDKNGYFLMTPLPAGREDPLFTSLYSALDKTMKQYGRSDRSSRDGKVTYNVSKALRSDRKSVV